MSKPSAILQEEEQNRRRFATPLSLSLGADHVIAYSTSIEDVQRSDLCGFLGHWDFQPPDGTLFEMLRGSTEFILAKDLETSVVCGYITALSDGMTCGYISALEVRPEYRRRGIGTDLLKQMVERLQVFAVYLSCAPEMVAFYEAAGFRRGTSMSLRKGGRAS